MSEFRYSARIPHFKYIQPLSKLGVSKFVVDDPLSSVTCERIAGTTLNHSFLNEAARLVHEFCVFNKIVFQCDRVFHDDDFSYVHEWISFLEEAGYDGIRVQDYGLLDVLSQKQSSLTVEFSPFAGHGNWGVIDFMSKSFALDCFVFAPEIDFPGMLEIKERACEVNLAMEFELLVHGRVLLFYTKRRLLQGGEFHLDSQMGMDAYRVFLSEEKKNDNLFEFVDNVHGSLLFYPKTFSLLGQYEKLKRLQPDWLLFDFSKESLDMAQLVVKTFMSVLSEDDETICVKHVEKINNMYPNGITESFFEQNLSDVRRRKTKNVDAVAWVMASKKDSFAILEALDVFHVKEQFILHAPAGSQRLISLDGARTLNRQPLYHVEPGDFVLIPWSKGISSGCTVLRDVKH